MQRSNNTELYYGRTRTSSNRKPDYSVRNPAFDETTSVRQISPAASFASRSSHLPPPLSALQLAIEQAWFTAWFWGGIRASRSTWARVDLHKQFLQASHPF